MLGRRVHYFAAVDSTMRVAAEMAERGESPGTVVLADEQTAGRGRFDRSWVSPPGVNLYFSLILRPALATVDAPLLTLALGLAVAEALRQGAGVACDLRWPNDVLLGGKKCCGILTELAAEGDRVRHVIAGIGVNVNQAEMPAELAATATSLRLETGREHSREALLDEILRQADHFTGLLVEGGAPAIVELFTRASSYARGKRVVVVDGGTGRTGLTAGLTPAGTLLLRQDDGAIVPVVAGSVRPLTE
jgi:BirA family biotin operon repressor/biotin-[acetyl-CoA-carboxylase] ligase